MSDEEQKAEIERLKALLVRAADTLEASKWDWHQARLLVDELRKAAQ